ncbi:MAG: amidohydrolase family protein [Deltaproteobacteria bacterium]|jgi:predicted TIM-barrel fold metal-dependent hydrolase|nr:amidohydrolase family protein [Deltaproteobacteria bacterium]
MIVDVHAHLSSPGLVADRGPYLKGEIGLSILYGDPAAKLVGTADLLAEMDATGVDKALVMGFPFSLEDNAKRHNDWILEECARHPGRLYPLAAFDQRAPWALRHSEAFLKAGGFGLGELCVYDEGLTEPMLESLAALAALCRERGAPMLVHVNEPIGHKYPGKAPMEISQIMDLVIRSQGTKLILAHFGGGLPLLACLKKNVKNFLTDVRFDTAAMPFIYEPRALRIGVDLLGADKFLLGTDHPLLKVPRYQKFFREAGLTQEETNLVSGQAAADFLGL